VDRVGCAEDDELLRLVIVDDEQLMRSGLRMILDSAPGIEVVDACDGPAALASVMLHRPGLVLLDVQMPGADGITVLRRLRALPDPPVVAMLTAFGSDDYVRSALQHGAVGYLLKDIDPDQLVREVHALATGGRSLAPGVTPAVIDSYLAAAPLPDRAADIACLTPREREALTLLGRGLTNSQIARRMHLAPSTAKDHVGTLLAKLGRVNRVQAAVLAERAGLLRTRTDQ
jgi:DNA-binding NarL/FixJ family response regulator